jgi:hypothetical protein
MKERPNGKNKNSHFLFLNRSDEHHIIEFHSELQLNAMSLRFLFLLMRIGRSRKWVLDQLLVQTKTSTYRSLMFNTEKSLQLNTSLA